MVLTSVLPGCCQPCQSAFATFLLLKGCGRRPWIRTTARCRFCERSNGSVCRNTGATWAHFVSTCVAARATVHSNTSDPVIRASGTRSEKTCPDSLALAFCRGGGEIVRL